IAVASDPDDVVAELAGVGPCHGDILPARPCWASQLRCHLFVQQTLGTVVADPSGAYIAVRDWNYSKGPYQVSPIGRKWNLVRIGRAEFIPSDEQIDAWPVIFVPSQQATLEDAAQHAFARIASRAITPDVNTTDN
ncbi:hypothetical protein, partial [Mycobacteroides abscessus]|uniref:hypothetical protein n=1 Tax=Mycobacteroides abscessus TaxID=36809 RepID=UPI001A9893F3